MIYVLDASVAFKWFVADEPFHDEAVALLEDVKNKPADYAVPELFFNEMLSAFCKVLNDAEKIQAYLDALQDLGFIRLENGRKTLAEAVSIAKKYNISGYDAIYAANARLVGGVWITADDRAHKKIAKLRISRLLGSNT